MPCATHTSRMGWRAYKTFPISSLPVARHCYLFGGLYGQVGWSLGITIAYNSFYILRVLLSSAYTFTTLYAYLWHLLQPNNVYIYP